MKALRLHGNRDLRYEDVPEPQPAPGQVKIKVSMAGICGSDLHEYSVGPRLISPDNIPLTLGHEYTGRIVELGRGVTGFKAGDRVTGLCYWPCRACYFCEKAQYNLCLNPGQYGHNTDGSMAEYMLVAGSSLFKIPDSVPDDIGVLSETLAVAIRAVRLGGIKQGDKVAIVGAGSIGLCALLAARAAGAGEVYIVDKLKGRVELASTLGAARAINLEENDPVEIVKEAAGGLGADVSLNCADNAEAPRLAIDLARRGGTTVLVGVSSKPASFYFETLVFDGKTVVGSPIYIDETKTALALLADKRIVPDRLITARVPLKDAAELGFEKLLNDKENNVKVLLQSP